MKKRRGDPLYLRKMAIIDRLVEPEYNKSMELKMIKQLSIKYSLEFLETIRLGFKLKSLIWFIGNGRKRIESFHKVYTLRHQEAEIEPIILFSKDKIGKDKTIKKKETISNFLNEKENTR